MKRTISLVVVALIALGSPSAFARKKLNCVQRHACTDDVQQNEGSGGVHLEIMPNWKPFLPKDTLYSVADHVGKSCDEHGNYVSQNTIYRCRLAHSPSTGQHFRVRRSQEGDRIFVMRNDVPELYVQFDGGGSDSGGSLRIIYQSSEAKQYAETHGYRYESRNSTMVAVGGNVSSPSVAERGVTNSGVSQATQLADCTQGSTLEKIRCMANAAKR